MPFETRRSFWYLVIGSIQWWRIVRSYTDPEELERLLVLRDSLRNKYSNGWNYAMETWTCPGEPDHQGPPGELVIQWDGQIGQSCDPCGSDPSGWGNWAELACFGGSGAPPGHVTSIHITDLITGIKEGVQTEVPSEFCLLKELREFDLDGNKLIGGIPDWIPSCFPHLTELDLSYNNLEGSVPSWISQVPHLTQVKFERNKLSGRIPEGFSEMEDLQVIRMEYNQLSGRLPDDFKDLVIEALWLHENPDLCGPMEAIQADSCKLSECGITTSGTRIGSECPSDAPEKAKISVVEELVPCEFKNKLNKTMKSDLPAETCAMLNDLYL